MRRALSVTVADHPFGVLWPLLGAELILALLLSSHGFPAAAVRALQLFLRF